MQKPDFQYLSIYEEGLTQPKKYDIIESDVVELAKELERYAQMHLMYAAARGLGEPKKWAEMAEREDWID